MLLYQLSTVCIEIIQHANIHSLKMLSSYNHHYYHNVIFNFSPLLFIFKHIFSFDCLKQPTFTQLESYMPPPSLLMRHWAAAGSTEREKQRNPQSHAEGFKAHTHWQTLRDCATSASWHPGGWWMQSRAHISSGGQKHDWKCKQNNEC